MPPNESPTTSEQAPLQQTSPAVSPVPQPPQPLASPPLNPVQPQPKKNHHKLIIILVSCFGGFIVLIVLGVIALFAVVSNATKAPLNVANDYISALRNGNYSAATDLESAAFKQAASQSLLTTTWQGFNIDSSSDKVIYKSTQSSNGQGETAIIMYKFSSDPSFYVKIELLKDSSNTWQVQNILGSPTEPSTSLQ
jgi:hypothetical protein